MTDTGHDTLLAAALAYTTLGWPVFPCRPGTKVPATEHGFEDATVDHTVIIGWATRRPPPNIAIATGAPGPDVLDIDVKKGAPGLASMRRLQDAGLLAGAALLVGTPSGGFHLFYRGTAQRNGSLPGHGVDFRSAGGYVVAPPSVVDGQAYLLHDARVPTATVDFARVRRFLDPPRTSLRDAQLIRPGRNNSWSGLAAHVAHQQNGNRNAALYWAACCAANDGAPPQAQADLIAAAIDAGLPEPEARRTVASAWRRYGGAS